MVSVAQLVEPRIVIPVVVGSSPIVHPIFCVDMGKYALLGGKVSSSLSPKIYKTFFDHHDLNINYSLYDCAPEDLADKLSCLKKQGYDGCNITNPLKQIATQYASVDNLTAMFGAANVIKFSANESDCAFNTDGVGLVRDLVRLGCAKGAKILLLGGGGVIAAISYNLIAAGADVTIAARDLSKLQVSLKGLSDYNFNMMNLASVKHGYDIVINATSTTLSDLIPSLPEDLLLNCHLYYDLSYADSAIQSLLLARDLGVPNCVSGIGMLVYQAAHAMQIWTGHMPSDSIILDTICKLDA